MTRLLLLLGGIQGGGGIQSYSRHLIAACAGLRGGVSMDVLLLDDRGRPARAATASDTPEDPIRLHPCGLSIRSGSKMLFAVRAVAAAVIRRPHLVLCGHLHLAPIALLLRRILGIPYVLEAHGWEFEGVRGRERMVREAARIHAASRFTKEKVLSIGGIDSSVIHVLPRPVDFRLFTPGPKPDRLLKSLGLKGNRVLLTVARLSSAERYKGHDQVLEALPSVRARHPDLAYVVVGEGDDRKRLERKAADLGLAPVVRFVGAAAGEEAVDYYRLSDLFIMPSRYEGFGIVYVEALACGKPVIAGNIDGARDALLDGRLGLLVDPRNSSEIGQAIESVLSGTAPRPLLDPMLLRETALQHFDLSRFHSLLKASIGPLLSSSPTDSPTVP